MNQPDNWTAGATYDITAPLSWFDGAQFAYVSNATTVVAQPIKGLSVSYDGKTEVGQTITLKASVDGTELSAEEQAKVKYTAKSGMPLVEISGNKVTLKEAGDVSIEAEYQSGETPLYVTIFLKITEPAKLTQIKDITENANYIVKGQVVGKNTTGFLVSDGTAAIYVFQGETPTVNVNDFVSVEGAVADYNNAKQFSTDAQITIETEGTAVTQTATPLTKEIADSFNGKTFATTDVKLYSWTATAGKAGKYDTLNFDGSTTVIEPTYIDSSAFKIEEGIKYQVEAYVTGYSTKSSYASVLLTKLTEAKGISVSIDKTSIKAGVADDFAQISVKATGGYTLADTTTYTSSDDTIATVDNTGKVLGVKASSTPVEITVTNGEYTEKVSITVTDPNVESYTVNFDDSFNTGFTTITADKVEKTLAGDVIYTEIKVSGSDIAIDGNALKNISPLRIYKNHTITFTAPEGKTISEISFDSVSGKQAFNATNASTEQGTVGSDGSIVLTAPANTITFTALNQFRVNSVTYTIK